MSVEIADSSSSSGSNKRSFFNMKSQHNRDRRNRKAQLEKLRCVDISHGMPQMILCVQWDTATLQASPKATQQLLSFPDQNRNNEE